MNRDPGLQPERTSMSWLRTQLLVFGVGIFLVRAGYVYSHLVVMSSGVVMLLYGVLGTYYTSNRFTRFFSNKNTVSTGEYRIKIMTSAIVSLGSGIYLMYLLERWFTN